MSQAKLEFLAGKSVPSIIDWMLENMKETDIRGCLEAAGIQTSVGSRSSQSSSSGAGSSTDPLPFSRAAAAGSSRDPLFSRAAAAGSSRDPLFSRAAAAGSSTDPLPFFTPGAATGFLSRKASEEQIRPGFYEPPSFIMREPSEEMIDPYSEELSEFTPGSRIPLFRDYDFGTVDVKKYNRFIKFQLNKQKEARQTGGLGNSINYIPLLIFDLKKENGTQYLSFIVIEPFNDFFRTRIIKIEASEQNFETEINTLLNQWVLYNPSIDNISSEVDLSFYNFLQENDSGYIYRNIQMLYHPDNISEIKSYNYFGAPGDEEDENIEQGDFFEGFDPFFNETEYDREKYESEYLDESNYTPPEKQSDFFEREGKKPELEGKNPELEGKNQNNLYDFGKDNFANKPKKFGKISDMNNEELKEYVINKFGQSYFNEYEPQVYTTKSGFGNVRYVKRSVPLSEPLNISEGYDYPIEEDNENGPVSFF